MPEEERLLLLDEVEDTQVTSLLQKLLSGETFGVEDFPAETPPTPKVDSDTVPISVEKRTLYPIPYTSMQAFLAAQYEKISTQIKEMERNIRRDLGLPERIISGKRRKRLRSASVVKLIRIRRESSGRDRTAAVERRGLKKVSAKGRAAATLDRLPRQRSGPVDADERYDSLQRGSAVRGRGLQGRCWTFQINTGHSSTIGSFLTWLSLEMVDR
ncbi:hypothetical protein Bca52824_026506 [Brassica carinata]|uniref:Uncharacterized protein n=1 Tax=Brassica carinata TaxID=52824 RepID=A0A8X7SGM1_BRACI|nr:hypothetical protein Bca52824_026506 [Brassica carinata]